MDIKEQAITEYLTQGTGYRKLAAKYGVSRTTINKWVMIHQGIHPKASSHLNFDTHDFANPTPRYF